MAHICVMNNLEDIFFHVRHVNSTPGDVVQNSQTRCKSCGSSLTSTRISKSSASLNDLNCRKFEFVMAQPCCFVRLMVQKSG